MTKHHRFESSECARCGTTHTMRAQHHADAACGLAEYCGRWCQMQHLGPEVPVLPLHCGQLSEECHSAL